LYTISSRKLSAQIISKPAPTNPSTSSAETQQEIAVTERDQCRCPQRTLGLVMSGWRYEICDVCELSILRLGNGVDEVRSCWGPQVVSLHIKGLWPRSRGWLWAFWESSEVAPVSRLNASEEMWSPQALAGELSDSSCLCVRGCEFGHHLFDFFQRTSRPTSLSYSGSRPQRRIPLARYARITMWKNSYSGSSHYFRYQPFTQLCLRRSHEFDDALAGSISLSKTAQQCSRWNPPRLPKIVNVPTDLSTPFDYSIFSRSLSLSSAAADAQRSVL